jgi:hypothetical protein
MQDNPIQSAPSDRIQLQVQDARQAGAQASHGGVVCCFCFNDESE